MLMDARRKPVKRNGALLFAENFLKHPGMLGSIVPSSRHLVSRVLEPVDWQRADVVVEYGPGVGGFTAAMLARMRPDARLVAIETNGAFVRHLGASLPDRRLHVEQGSAIDVAAVLERLGIQGANVVVSGIPLGSLPVTLRLAICEASRRVLEPAGTLLVYQFTPRVLPQLRQTFARVQCGIEWRNVPPARYYVCRNG